MMMMIMMITIKFKDLYAKVSCKKNMIMLMIMMVMMMIIIICIKQKFNT